MEKIYEKEQFDEQSFQYKKKSNLNSSVVLSFMVAFFAVFSLIVCGFNEISYASPDNTFAEKITFYHYTKDDEDVVTLVTTMDMDPENMLISIESDLGKALKGKKAGDIVEVEAPGTKYSIEILELLN